MENLNQLGKTSLKNKIHKRKGSDITDISIEGNEGDILDTKGERNNLKELKKEKLKRKKRIYKKNKIKKKNKYFFIYL